jgi:hypothetical protein
MAMVKLAAVVMVVLALWADGVLAEDGPTLLQEEMARNPDRFGAGVADLISGFGQDGALTAQGVEDHIALVRAGARATALRRLIALDLDADGDVTGKELATAQAAAGATARGRLQRQFTGADQDGDGRVTATEATADAGLAALRALDEEEAAVLRALLTLDRDGDRALSVEELDAALDRARIAADSAT